VVVRDILAERSAGHVRTLSSVAWRPPTSATTSNWVQPSQQTRRCRPYYYRWINLSLIIALSAAIPADSSNQKSSLITRGQVFKFMFFFPHRFQRRVNLNPSIKIKLKEHKLCVPITFSNQGQWSRSQRCLHLFD